MPHSTPQHTQHNQTSQTALGYELEGPTRFSESHMWKLMSSYYDRKGVQAFAMGNTPMWITNNARFSR